MMGAAALVARAIVLSAITIAVGAVVFRLSVIARATGVADAVLAEWNTRSTRLGALAAAAIVLVAPARLYFQAASFVMEGDPVMPMMRNVLMTGWGRGWKAQAGIALVACVALWLARRVTAMWAVAALAVLALSATPAFMGHAAAAEHLAALSVGADWTHVIAAGAWIGTLVFLAIVVGGRDSDVDGATAARAIECFHPVALASAAILVATGVTSLWLRVEHLADLLHSAYGAILGVKLALTAGVAAVGLHHSRHGVRLARAGGPAALRRTLLGETLLAAGVIAATAALIATSPHVD